jgi:hypothetical protein
VLQLSAWLIEHFTERYRDQFQVRSQALELRRGQGGEKFILIRTMGS